jgi:predicted outer membrane repeat protein
MKNLKLLVLICNAVLLYLIPVSQCAAEIISVSGDITQDSTWHSTDTVQVTGDVRVMDNISLTIEPGAYIEFQGHYFLKIYGDLQAEGTESDSIIFTASNPATGWKGIRFNNTMYDGGDFWYLLSDTSNLSYCRIEYTKSYPAIYVRIFSKINISHCFFYRNTSSETSGNAICQLQGGGVISDCHFLENTSITSRKGGALYLAISDAPHIVRNCTFVGNSNGDGGAVYFSSSYGSIENCLFVNNSATTEGGAIVLANSDDVVLSNNLIVNNSATLGGAIFNRGSSVTALNNTIANNSASTSGGAIYFEANADASFYSNIIYGNKASGSPNQMFIDDDRSDPAFYNCNVEGGSAAISLSPGIELTGTYDNNIDINPEFILPASVAGAGSGSLSDDWGIKAVSPCINTGVTTIAGVEIPQYDLAGSKRIAFGDIDMGAYEFYDSELTTGGTIALDVVWAADTVRVTSDVTVNDGFTLTILPGVYVQFQDNWGLDIQGRLLANGKKGNPVIFSVKDTLGFTADYSHTGWKGIKFNNTPESNEQSQIDHAILEYGKGINGGVLYVNNFSKLDISNSVFRYNTASSSGGAVYCLDAGVSFTGCSLLQNTSDQQGGGIFGQNSDMTFKNALISSNTTGDGGGIHGREGSVIVIENSQIINNHTIKDPNWSRGGAIGAYNFCSLRIDNSIIANNTSNGTGGAIFIWGGSILGVNSLIVNNLSDSSYAGGISSVDDADVSFYNSIIRGNEDDGSNSQIGNDVKLYNSNVAQFGSFGPNNINLDPEFYLPTAGAGHTYDALTADWHLTDFSPGINTGTNTIPGSGLPEKDLDGNARINQGIVDMGVYEHQGSLPEITYHPDNLILCEGNPAAFQVQISDTARFQWQKDGFNILGADSSQLSIDSISMADQGNYRCIVWNAYDTILSNPAYLFVVQLPTILLEPEDTWVGYSGKTELRAYASGNNLSYQWLKNDTVISGAILPDYMLSVSDSTDEGLYSCVISNTCSTDTTAFANVYLAPQICMVTVDTATGNNLVVWERKSAGPIQNYNVYRESKYAGIYDLLGSVPYGDLTVISDSTADATVQAYLYKITAVDTGGIETDPDLSETHKTIHLLATKNPETNATQLDWDRYVGFEYGSYEIYRSDTTINFSSIHQMSSSTSTWADGDPGEGTKFYRVAAVKPGACYPFSPLKAGAGPYHHSLSNLDNNKLQNTGTNDIIDINKVRVYPNPMDNRTTIQFSNPTAAYYQFSVIDPSGRRVYFQENISSDRIEFFREDLPSGMYMYELRGPKIHRGKILIK